MTPPDSTNAERNASGYPADDDDDIELQSHAEDPEIRARRLGTKTTPITLGSLRDILGIGKPVTLACRILDDYALEVQGECLRCHQTLRPLLHDGSFPGPARSLARDINENWHICDPCAAEMKSENEIANHVHVDAAPTQEPDTCREDDASAQDADAVDP